MNVKVKFRDTEFGLFEPSFTVPVLGTGQRFRGIYLDFKANGVPWSQLVLDQSIQRHQMLEDTLDENPVFASATDMVYWIIERILDSQCECGEEIEIEYEGEEEGKMQDTNKQEKTIQIPADAERVTLEIKKRDADKPRIGCTLAEALAMTPSDRPVIVRVLEHNGLRWDVTLGHMKAADCGRLRGERIGRFSTCHLCDTQVLLKRLVRAVGIKSDTQVGDAIVYEVENDGE